MLHTSLRILKTRISSRLPLHHPSSLRGASWSELNINPVVFTFEDHKRRGNLPSLIDNKEPFIISRKNTSLRTQRKEIASWIQQRLAKLTLNILSTETRNDEEKREGVYAYTH
jgi:hypothetical protein